ncbi:MAG: DUF309 domain-containing protein [Desulfuromonadales bacterium]|nr:DUF309 domain-containing protein [Desulfuromonadales bacterium]MBN2791946.1 DUF309 domain-containing protein [Desulfuromonadales bacterium]
MTKTPRYTDNPFPSYRYIPFSGDMPHPRNDPEGHSYGIEEDYLSDFSASDWESCQPYLYGVDLFNNAYWWEAHEAWEACWLAAGRGTRVGTFVQGLIQIAAGQLKLYMRGTNGARLLTTGGLEKISCAQGIYLGIEVSVFSADVLNSLMNDGAESPLIRLHFSEQ